MSQTATQEGYKPQFPESYQKLLHLYTKALETENLNTRTWCQKTITYCEALTALKNDGALPGLFTRNFGLDVREVMKQAQKGIEGRYLSEEQGTLTFALANLQAEFRTHRQG